MIFTYGIKQKLWLAFKILIVQAAMCLWGAAFKITNEWAFIGPMATITFYVIITTYRDIRKDIRRLKS